MIIYTFGGNNKLIKLHYDIILYVSDFNKILFVKTDSVRVGNELGAGNPKAASFSVVVVTVISFIISIIAAVTVLALRNVISYAFTDGEIVAAAVSDLCPLLALTLLLNGVQPVLSGKNYTFWFLFFLKMGDPNKKK